MVNHPAPPGGPAAGRFLPPGTVACAECGEPFLSTGRDKVAYCNKPACLAARNRAEIAARAQSDLRRNQEQQKLDLATAREELETRGLDDGEVPVTISLVPHVQRDEVPLPPARAAAFLANLVKSLQAILKGPESYEPKQWVADDVPASRLNIAACTACRGYCCRLGADHAFLKPGYLATLYDMEGADSVQNVVTRYASHLPERHLEQSCVFHTTTGCALPREMRSDVCNAYMCKELADAESHARSSPERPVFVAAMLDGEIGEARYVEPPQDDIPDPKE